MARSKVSRFALVLLLVAALLPMGFTSAQNKQKRVVSKSEEQQLLAQMKIDSNLAAAFAEDEYVHVLVKFKEQADPQLAADLALSKLQPETAAYNRKLAARNAVVDALQQTAAGSQGWVLDYLKQEQRQGKVKEIDSYFIVNMVHILATAEVVDKLALRPEVAKVFLSDRIAMEKPIRLDEEILSGPGRQWNIDNVGAYDVWDDYGLDGTGVVVGMLDTGIYYQHEALVKKWRGYKGPGSYDPVYNWFDAIDGRTMPYDEPSICHGTHVMGTILGGHPDTNNLIGVAPGAKWITARAFDDEGGYNHWILNAAQYLLAPTDSLGNPNPAMAPDIINNSWGGGPGLNEWFRPMVLSWRAAQILPVFSAGNTTGGSSPASVSAPANYPESIAVAAIDSSYKRGNFSNQGPGPYADLKPDISAPGVNIRSSVIGGGYESGWNGTSMASPHVAGVAALLFQANSALTVDAVEEILYTTTDPLTDAQYPASPNYGYGRGIVNGYDAVTSVLSGFGTVSGRVLVAGATEPIAGAKVRLLRRTVTCDAQGRFTIENVVEGSHILRVTAAGFASQDFPVTVVADETATITVGLTPRSAFEDEIAYDDGEQDNAWAYYDSGNGWGVRFTPEGEAAVIGARVFIDLDWPEPGSNKLSVAVYDSLPNGEPGERVIAPYTVAGVRGQWNYIDLSEHNFVTDRDFYIFYVQVGDFPDCAALGFDESSNSGRTYELWDGELSPKEGNAMIRAAVLYPFPRLAGSNRYETAVKVSEEGWESAENVVLARGNQYADALAGAPLAYAVDGPILLTSSASLSPVTRAEIQRLGASKVYILGGPGAISQEVENTLVGMGLIVERISGNNRYSTAAKIAALVAPSGTATVVLASGQNFPDALSSGAYAARAGMPILLSRGDRLSAEAGQALASLGVTQTILIGGTGVLSETISSAVPGGVRIVGSNRYVTSVEVAKYFQPDSDAMYVATGLQFADALGGAVLAAKNNSGILLVGSSVHAETRRYLQEQGVKQLTIFGGFGAVSLQLEASLVAILN